VKAGAGKKGFTTMKLLPLHATIGESYGPAMKITDQQEASEYFEMLVQSNMRHGTTRAEAESIERQNLGYYAGYYDSATRERVEKLFSCAHPFFGSIAENGAPTPEQALETGRKLANK
jgi:hypothetical protein